MINLNFKTTEEENQGYRHVEVFTKIHEAEFRKLVLETYRENTNVQFDPEANKGEAGQLFNLVIDYYLGNQSFLENPLLVNPPATRSFGKGLLIMGKPGTGKTSTIKSVVDTVRNKALPFVPHKEVGLDPTNKEKSFEREPQDPEKIIWKFINPENQRFENTAIDTYRGKAVLAASHIETVVREYEEYLRGKTSLFGKISKTGPTLFIDDILSERAANNYGDKLETMKQVLEDMEYREHPLILTCNLHEDPENMDENKSLWQQTIDMIGKRYGVRAYDRLFSSLNFVEMKGESLRG